MFRITKACYTSLPDAITFDRKASNHVLPSLAGSFDKLNLHHFYHATFTTKYPYDGKKHSVHYYYSKVHKKPPSQPTQTSDVEDVVSKTHSYQADQKRISNAEKQKDNNERGASPKGKENTIIKTKATAEEEGGGGGGATHRLTQKKMDNLSCLMTDVLLLLEKMLEVGMVDLG